MHSIGSIQGNMSAYNSQKVNFGANNGLSARDAALLKSFEQTGDRDYNGKVDSKQMTFKKAVGYTALTAAILSAVIYKLPLKHIPKNGFGNLINNYKVKLINLVDLAKTKIQQWMPKGKEVLDDAVAKGKEVLGKGATEAAAEGTKNVAKEGAKKVAKNAVT